MSAEFAESAMSAEANQVLVRRLVEAHNNRDDAAIDELLADGVAVHPLFHQPVTLADRTRVPEGGTTMTREMRRRNRARECEEFPDLRMTIDALFAAGDVVTAVITNRGTHRSGKAVTWKAVIVHRIEGGKVVELWSQWDRLGYYQQLGLVPETSELLRQVDALP